VGHGDPLGDDPPETCALAGPRRGGRLAERIDLALDCRQELIDWCAIRRPRRRERAKLGKRPLRKPSRFLVPCGDVVKL
jgi:hypothetical protein